MKTFQYNNYQVSDGLFDLSIDKDSWIAFHGTSSIFEHDIESEGLCFNSNAINIGLIKDVISIYEAIGWYGEDPGGFAVLKPFSLEHDRSSNSPAVYFAESSFRASLYAGKDYAGGEAARAMRHSIKDLYDFSNNKLQKLNPSDSDRRYVQRKLLRSRNISHLLDDQTTRHRYGVVYAVRFGVDDLKNLAWKPNMGILSFHQIPIDMIKAKIILPTDYLYDPSLKTKRLLERLKEPDDLLNLLKTHP